MSEIIREEGAAETEIEAVAADIQQSEREVVFEEALEAILFAAGHPITYATLARVFEMTPSKVKEKVAKYSALYNNSEIPRGVILLTYADSCQLCTKKYYLSEIRDALGIRKSGTLSSSSMEALAIVAYNQPVTRVFVDTLRRVDSSYAMNNLIDRGLIESKGKEGAVKSVKNSRVPILILHGKKDSFVPYEMAKEIYDSAKCEKEIHIFDDADHGMSYMTDPEKYEELVNGFVKKCLNNRPCVDKI